ncbi:MAG TPA: proline dehydrogenase family protein [Enhygromyxa sp.]|nr:proline dehydrogenase family protein [Enhygromyxa sp.]
MLRNALLWASTNRYLAQRLPSYGFVKRATRRFMPGETVEDAITEALTLEAHGIRTTFTLLGENVETDEQADAVAEHYLGVLARVREQGLDTEISVKLTQLGLDQDLDGARRRLQRLAQACEPGALVWVDMESSRYVDPTVEVFRAVRAGHANLGLCLQAYLLRTEQDLDDLLELSPAIRLVKGAYQEPAEIAYPRKADVDRNYVRLTEVLLRARAEGGGRPVIATHDPRMIAEAQRIARELELPRQQLEFSMLYGIQSEAQQRLAREGYASRTLIAYGSAWFPWYMRRLAERPANLWFVAKQLLR